VVRYLAPEIVAAGWQLSLVSGSVGATGDLGYAPEFFSPLPVTVVDYTPAMDVWRSGGDPFFVAVPLQPSFEDRRGAPDRVFASLDDADFERQVSAWSHAVRALAWRRRCWPTCTTAPRSTRRLSGSGPSCPWSFLCTAPS
jgi:hypothetical protein